MGENPDSNEIRAARIKAVAHALGEARGRLAANEKDIADAPFFIGALVTLGWKLVPA